MQRFTSQLGAFFFHTSLQRLLLPLQLGDLQLQLRDHLPIT